MSYETLRTEMPLLESFVRAAEAYGITGMEHSVEDGAEVIRQKVGEGWPGLGYDGSNLWLDLTPKGNLENGGWNANTVLESGTSYEGIEPGKNGRILAEHPLAKLFSARHDTNPDSELHLTGGHANWQQNDSTKLSLDDEGNLHGNIPVGTEIKVVVTGVDAEWKDGGWGKGTGQELKMKSSE